MDYESEGIEQGKIFVGGLSWETTQEGLKQHFAQYGEVTDCVIMQDPVTKRPRGFGFVTFKDSGVVNRVVETPHMLDNKKVDPKPATQKAAHGSVQSSEGVKKVFVGGIAHGTTEDDVRSYFSQFGPISDVDLKYDKQTNRMRGFGFVGFEDGGVVDKLCQTHFHQLNGKTVEVKKAEPRYATAAGQGGGGGGYASGGYGRGGGFQQGQYGGYTRGGYPGGQYSNYGYGGAYGGGQQQYGAYGGSAGYAYPPYQGAGYAYEQRYSTGQQETSGTPQGRADYSAYAYPPTQQQVNSYAPESAGYGTGRSGYGSDSYSQQHGYGGYDTSNYAGYTNTDTPTSSGYGRGAAQQRGYAPYGGR